MAIRIVVNPLTPQTVRTTSVFYGSANVQPQVQAAEATANLAIETANTAYIYANAAFSEANTLANTIDGGTFS